MLSMVAFVLSPSAGGLSPGFFFLGIELVRDLSTFVDESGDRGGRALKTGAGRTKGYLLRIERSACIRLASLLGGKWPNLTDMRSGAGVSRVARKRILGFCWRGFPCVGRTPTKPQESKRRGRVGRCLRAHICIFWSFPSVWRFGWIELLDHCMLGVAWMSPDRNDSSEE